DVVDDAGHLVARGARILDARPDSLLRQRVAVADAARLDLDTHHSRARLGKPLLDEIERTFRASHSDDTHGAAHRRPPKIFPSSLPISRSSSLGRVMSAGVVRFGPPASRAYASFRITAMPSRARGRLKKVRTARQSSRTPLERLRAICLALPDT